jgi:hypothetical protein
MKSEDALCGYLRRIIHDNKNLAGEQKDCRKALTVLTANGRKIFLFGQPGNENIMRSFCG